MHTYIHTYIVTISMLFLSISVSNPESLSFYMTCAHVDDLEHVLCLRGWVTIPGKDGCCIVNSTMMKTPSTVKKAMTTSTIMTIITAMQMINIGKNGHGFDSVEHHNQKNDTEY